MESISVFLNVTKFVDFRQKNANVSRTQGGVPRGSDSFWNFFK